MILKKLIIDGKEVFAPVDRQEAKDLLQKGTKLVFTDEDEQEELEDEIEEELEAQQEAEEEAAEEAAEALEDDEKEDESIHEIPNFKHLGDNIQRMVDRQLRHALHRPTHRHFYKDTSTNPNSKLGRLLKVLPFMSRDDLHELVEDLLKNDESLEDANIVAFLPFLSQQDCDALFMKALQDDNEKFDPLEIAPFVSSKVLTLVVDDYLNGKFQDTAMDELYPFLSSQDVKRVFKHIMSQKKAD